MADIEEDSLDLSEIEEFGDISISEDERGEEGDDLSLSEVSNYIQRLGLSTELASSIAFGNEWTEKINRKKATAPTNNTKITRKEVVPPTSNEKKEVATSTNNMKTKRKEVVPPTSKEVILPINNKKTKGKEVAPLAIKKRKEVDPPIKKKKEATPLNKIKKDKKDGVQEIKDLVSTTAGMGGAGVLDMTMASSDFEERLLSLEFREHSRVLVTDTETLWHEESNSDNGTILVSQAVVDHLLSLGGQVMTCEIKLYKKLREKKRGRDVQWLKTVLSSGTLNDKMAAMTLLIQESTIHSLSTIDFFISLSKKRSKRENLVAIDHFKDLLVSDVLPESRKLKFLKQRPLERLLVEGGGCGSVSCDTRTLILWYFEHQLKTKYLNFLELLKELLHDPVAEIREKITGVIFDLMYHRPEQEQLLLRMLVNKLGDPNRKIASKCILFLQKLLTQHVNMKLIVVREIESLLYRPNVLSKTQYYSICFLNQIVIGPSDQLLPQKLVSLYFSFFKFYVDKNDFDAKILSALLTGVNRALPFLRTDIPSFDDHLNSLFKIAQVGPLATSVQALTLLYQVMEKRTAVSSRFYRALYRKLGDHQLSARTGQQAMFLNLLFKSLKSDPELNRNKAFIKRILQACDHHMPHYVCGCLLILSEILKVKPFLWSFILQSESMESFKDVPEDELRDEGEEKEEEEEEENNVTEAGSYSMTARDPSYCKAESTTLWELSRLIHHYHPSVQVFAGQLASGNVILYDGDPLSDFTIIRFLDHFVHKNPKQKKSDHGGSLMQPTGSLIKTEVYTLPSSLSELAKMNEEKVRSDLQFIHKFMRKDMEMHRVDPAKATRLSRRKRKKKEDNSLSIEEDDDEAPADFASEFKKQVENEKRKNKNDKKKKQDDDGSEGEESASEGDYSDMNFSDFEDSLDDGSDDEERGGRGSSGGKEKEDLNEMERLLLDNLSSSDEEEIDVKTSKNNKRGRQGDDDEEEIFNKKSKRSKDKSVFASAEEFAHLLEGTDESKKKTKESRWEELRSSAAVGHGRGHGGRGGRGRGGIDRARGRRDDKRGERGRGGRGREATRGARRGGSIGGGRGSFGGRRGSIGGGRGSFGGRRGSIGGGRGSFGGRRGSFGGGRGSFGGGRGSFGGRRGSFGRGQGRGQKRGRGGRGKR